MSKANKHLFEWTPPKCSMVWDGKDTKTMCAYCVRNKWVEGMIIVGETDSTCQTEGCEGGN